jgi:uncharacterized BrkB/YihY/UPF0761 family membrane protein
MLSLDNSRAAAADRQARSARSGPTAGHLLRWPILGIAFVIALAVLYRYRPSRHEPRWRWVSWGAVLATIVWLDGLQFVLLVRL